jgi:hypothetical protein
MVMVAETDLVGSVTEVAVTVTVFPGGAEKGAVYSVEVNMLNVVVGVMRPH